MFIDFVVSCVFTYLSDIIRFQWGLWDLSSHWKVPCLFLPRYPDCTSPRNSDPSAMNHKLWRQFSPLQHRISSLPKQQGEACQPSIQILLSSKSWGHVGASSASGRTSCHDIRLSPACRTGQELTKSVYRVVITYVHCLQVSQTCSSVPPHHQLNHRRAARK